jgi:glycosyltransferase involved in cell wall biosynthesis
MPEISVVMSVYNGERFLREAVRSILDQSFSDFEYIIVNDRSTDQTASILASFNDRRIRLVHNSENIGLTASLNKGIALAQGKFIARMDADDISLSGRLEHQVDFLKAHSEIGVLGTAYQVIDQDGNSGIVKSFPTSSAVIKWRLCFENPIVHPSVMMRCDILERAGGYNPEMMTAQDYDLWQRVSVFTRLSNLPDVLIKLRKHDLSVTIRQGPQQRKNSSIISQHMMSSVLDEDIQLSMGEMVWERSFKEPQDVYRMAEIQLRICRAVIADPNCSKDDQLMVRKEAALKLYGWFRAQVADLHAWGILGWALRLNPLLLFELAQKKI